KAIMDVALHFASFIREHVEQFQPDELGNIRISHVMFEQTVKKLHEIYGMGWSKQYREGSISATMSELIEILFAWEMLTMDEETNAYIIRPLIGRVTG